MLVRSRPSSRKDSLGVKADTSQSGNAVQDKKYVYFYEVALHKTRDEIRAQPAPKFLYHSSCIMNLTTEICVGRH